MTDDKKDPDLITDGDLDNVQGGMKIPNLFSGEGKVLTSYDLVSESPTVTAEFGDDKLGDFLDKANLTKGLK